ncbi:MAG: hypothetical protein R2733_20180 [Acidimicrobiales bacterium]
MNSLNREHLLEHLAERLQQGGVRHPAVAAAVLAARGATRCDQRTYARQLRIRLADLQAAEAGETALDDLPPQLRSAIEPPAID